MLFAKCNKILYHSLIAKRDTVPDTLEVIAEDRDGEVMGVKHKDFELYGLQFHPESENDTLHPQQPLEVR